MTTRCTILLDTIPSVTIVHLMRFTVVPQYIYPLCSDCISKAHVKKRKTVWTGGFFYSVFVGFNLKDILIMTACPHYF